MVERAHVRVDITADSEADAQELDDLALKLRRELLQLDVDAVNRERAGPAPAVARAVDVEALGTMIVTIATTAGSLVSLAQAVAGWLGRTSKARTVRLEIDGDVLEIADASGEQVERLVSLWTERHAGGP